MKSHSPAWVLVHVRAGQEVFRQEVLESGFELVAEPECPELEENYIMIFQRPKPAPVSRSDLSNYTTDQLLAELEARLK
jgi:hypothetical protein